MGRREVYTGFWRGGLREGVHLGDLHIEGTIILRWKFRKWDRGIDWIELAQDRDRWHALVNASMNLQVL